MSSWVVLAHGDGDGVVSGALACAYIKTMGSACNVFFTHPVGIVEDLKSFTKQVDNIVVLDIAVDELYKDELLGVLKTRAESGKVLYIDHHPLPEGFNALGDGVEFIHDPCCSASELSYRYFSGKGLDPEYGRVALYGAISDYLDETAWVRSELLKWDRRGIYLEAGIITQGLEGSRRDHEFKRKVVAHLSGNKLPSTLPDLVSRALHQAVVDEELRLWVKANVNVYGDISYVIDPRGSLGRAANYAMVYGGTLVGVAAESRGDIYVLSLRSRGGVDLNKVLRELSRRLNIHGGGHPYAAGARVKKDVFKQFLDELAVCIQQEHSKQPEMLSPR
ncbi:DHH family phosphoesterase [Thermosphaera chiliense]|uniref:DHH family phosphoesterase n=1 Tax=Thermosphaera chiliense TaxID=3402707 RepID=A0A7M1UQN7_9CREN|nr:DHHA1 domain-containing protein [Thermosphaera aggregans]QOR94386.1 DHH family phosphoesterase [Thermosphaera aggregans]